MDKEKANTITKKKKAAMVRVTSMIKLTSVTHEKICYWSWLGRFAALDIIQKKVSLIYADTMFFKIPHTSFLSLSEHFTDAFS